MTTTEAGTLSRAVLDEHVAAIDGMLAQPFPETARADRTGHAGPGHRVRLLRESRDFWDDEDGRAMQEADAEMSACLDALVAVFTDRWGEPVDVDLWSYLTAGYEDDGAADVPEPIESLCQLAVTLWVWPLPEHDRWLGLTVGQGDKELPLELLAAVGRGPVPARSAKDD
ncbi:hypothetical protein ACFVHB_14220 [Kitasatospora sp. NPDC127111]|uniref:hypothetical protein n=1 Tax=Kitasatospora sp. NPDC127111 TaxID=3345363 RepID=UPI003627F690